MAKGLGPGGTEQLILTSARYWNREEFDYEVGYILPSKSDLVASLRSRDVPVTCFASGSSPWPMSLREHVRSRQINLVHAHAPHPAAVARVALRGRSQPRHVYTEHGPWDRYKRRTYLANMLTYPANDHVFAVSGYVERSISVPGPLPWFRDRPPVETLHHGFDPVAMDPDVDVSEVRAELGFEDDHIVITMVANFRPQKRHRVFLKAVQQAVDAAPQLRFLLVGGGPLEGEMRQMSRRFGLASTVTFTGYRSDVPRLLAASDVFALSSAFEGLPIALLEALALGLPVIATDAPGTDEVIRDRSEGLLVPPDDSRALAEAFVEMGHDPELRQELAQMSRKRAGAFSIEQAVRRQEAVYRRLLSGA